MAQSTVKPPYITDMSCHSGIAAELTQLLTTAQLQVPIQKVRDMTEILDWLGAIKDGNLVIAEAEKATH